MKKLIILILFNLITINQLLADSRIIGKWLSDDGIIIEVLDGFQVSTGPILKIDEDKNFSSGSWKLNDDNSINITFGYSENLVEFIDKNNFKWGYSSIFTKTSENDVEEKTSLKNNPDSFVDKLVKNLWSTTLSNKKADFSKTFTKDSGVVEYADIDGKKSQNSWSIASNVFKLADTVIIEASISSNYFIGLDSQDKFIVFKNIGKSSIKQKTAMSEKREEFFDAFLTGSWERTTWGSKTIYKFRPIYGELKGRKFDIRDNKLQSYSNWEYSPSTGALKISGTEYIQATLVGEILVLLNKAGDQYFYSRSSESDGKRYTLADVKQVPLNENSLLKLEKELSSQFQYSDYIYKFEFSNDGRTGFVHKFHSKSFTITGETFYSEDMISKSNVLYTVEDFVLFDERNVFKRDASEARLKVKTEEEIIKDVSEQSKSINDLSVKQLLAVITLSDGNVVEVPLGITDFDDVKKIELLVE